MKNKILMIIAPQNYRDEELEVPMNIFKQNEYEVIICSKGTDDATGSEGGNIKVDIDLHDAKVDDYKAIVFVGGSGTIIYFNSFTAQKIATEAASKGLILGAICIAPSILANAGILKDTNVTAFPSESTNLIEHEANYTKSDVVVDDKIITASGPHATVKFANEIIKAIEKDQ